MVITFSICKKFALLWSIISSGGIISFGFFSVIFSSPNFLNFVELVGMLGFEPRSEGSHTPVISATFTCPCSRLKPVRVPGIEPGSKGSKPLMLSVTPHPQKASAILEKTPSGSEPREVENAGLHWVESTLMGSNSSAMPIPPTEFLHVHCNHLFSQQDTISALSILKFRFPVDFQKIPLLTSTFDVKIVLPVG